MKCTAGLLVFASLVFLVSADPRSLCEYPEAEFTALAECVRTALGDSEVGKKLVSVRSTSECTTDVCILRKLCDHGHVPAASVELFTPEEKAVLRTHVQACKQHP